jgi:subtilase family serine protease
VFFAASAWGVLVLTPMYFMFDVVGRQDPPPITHPQFYYGFACAALAWQFAYFLIGTDPARFRPMMIVAVFAKMSYFAAVAVLYLQARLSTRMFAISAPDALLGSLFLVAFFKTPAKIKIRNVRRWPIRPARRTMRAYHAIVTAILLPIAVMQAAERQVLHGHVPQAVANARVLGRVSRSERLNLAIGLPLRNQEGLELLLQQLYDPASPNYHQYQKPEEFAAQFGPTEHDYQALIRFAESNGLVVTGTHPNRTILDVSGAVADIERVLHLNMMSYWHPVRGTFYAPDREPSLDLDVRVLDISGLDNFELPRPMGLKTMPLDATTPFVTGSGPGGFFIGGDFRAAYAPGVTLNGTGQVVGLLEFDSFYASDVQANFKQAGLPAVPTQMVLLDGVSGVPGGANIEVILDIMMASYMAPGLSKVMVYEGSTPNDILNRMATDNLAQQLSSSWGYGPVNATTEQIFKQYIAQGQSLLQASGDGGAYEGGVMTPSDDPNLTVVGGTSLTTSGAGGPWQSEVTWPGSGGGTSVTYPIPSYQQGTNMAVNGGSSTMRNIPDVALTADIQMFLICNNGQAISVGGTSAAAPLWAGFIALANQQALAGGKPSVGFLNPLIYSIGNGTNYSADFHDITLGNNYGFSAMSGYDLATGWGAPSGQPLINDLSGALAAPAFTLSLSPLVLSISSGSSGVSTLTVGAENGFSGSVTLAASGLPKGVTASFSPTSTTGASTLTLMAAGSATAGTTTVTVTGTSGILKSTATISLAITVPNFTLSASPGTLSIPQGNSGVSTVTVGPQNGFSSSVSLAVSGLPKGVTASFSPVSTAGASTLTVVAAGSATAGTATVTVTGTSGTLQEYSHD